MAFVGSVNSLMRSIIAEVSKSWKGRPIYVGCSGNFTIERILYQVGLRNIHSNDVSLYSSIVGAFLEDKNIKITAIQDDWLWLNKEDYLEPGAKTIATLLLLMEMVKYYHHPGNYFERMVNEYHSQWPRMHALSTDRVRKATQLKIKSYYPGDVVDFVASAPDDAVVVSFPPTYKGGYELLYKRLNAMFDWKPPQYTLFDEDRVKLLNDMMMAHPYWCTSRDHELPGMEEFCIGEVQETLRAKKVYMYASSGKPRTASPRQELQQLKIDRLDGEVGDDLKLVPITNKQLNLLRSEYLSLKIATASAEVQFAVVTRGQLIGAIAFSSPTYLGNFCDAFVLADFAIRPTVYRKLAKLVLAAVLSTEVKSILEQKMSKKVETLGTTVYTERAVSMKYRSMFEIKERRPEEKKIMYMAKAGRWSLADGLNWWKKNHSDKREQVEMDGILRGDGEEV